MLSNSSHQNDQRISKEGLESLSHSPGGGIFSLLASAIQDRHDAGFEYLLAGGDLNQMSQQEAFLVKAGFTVGRENCYPAVRTQEEYVRALRAIFSARIEGWWHYEQDLVSNKICTQAQYNEALGRK